MCGVTLTAVSGCILFESLRSEECGILHCCDWLGYIMVGTSARGHRHIVDEMSENYHHAGDLKEE